MTIKNFTALLIGLIFCFSLMAKQIQQTHSGFDHTQTVQDILPETSNTNNQLDALDADNEFDVIDDIILIPLLPVITTLLLTLLLFFSRLYSQPTFLVPLRPPSNK
jgi:hypothetical protein